MHKWKLTIALSLCVTLSHAQGHTSWWYFGHHAGLHFENFSPQPDTNGLIGWSEGSAVVSDAFGNLLFYTDGMTVYNRDHVEMPNGTGLWGHLSSTQPAVCVTQPQSNHRTYCFSPGSMEFAQTYWEHLKYSVVDMHMENGWGDVVPNEKNILLRPKSAEKIAIAPMQNEDGYWIVSHSRVGDTFFLDKLTPDGVFHHNSQIFGFSIGDTSTLEWQNVIGELRFSPDYKILAMAGLGTDTIFLFSFDPSTGAIDSFATVKTTLGCCSNGSGNYRLEFSSSGQYLYAIGRPIGPSILSQYDLNAGTSTQISASEVILHIGSGISQTTSGLQRAVNGKIYVSKPHNEYLGVVENPDLPGFASNYIDSGLHLGGRIGSLGLPAFSPGALSPAIGYQGYCLQDSMLFTVSLFVGDSILWGFGDPASGAANTSGEFQPHHVFSSSGLFTVSAILFSNDTVMDTLYKTIRIPEKLLLELSPDTTICHGDTIVIRATSGLSEYFSWSTGSDSTAITTSQPGIYFLTVANYCDTITDSISVLSDHPLGFSLGNDTNICAGTSFSLIPTLPSSTLFQWHDGSSIGSYTLSPPDTASLKTETIHLTAINACGSWEDSVTVTIYPKPQVNLGADIRQCGRDTVYLRHKTEKGVDYVWLSSGMDTIAPNPRLTSDATIVIFAMNLCGLAADTVSISFTDTAHIHLGRDTLICPGDSVRVNASTPNGLYLWNTGDTTSSVTVTNPGIYRITISYGSCTNTAQRIFLLSSLCPKQNCSILFPNIFTPNNDGINDLLVFDTKGICTPPPDFHILIYNRWGQLVWESAKPNSWWDGNINGQPASEGVYFYMVTPAAKGQPHSERPFIGSFSLLR